MMGTSDAVLQFLSGVFPSSGTGFNSLYQIPPVKPHCRKSRNSNNILFLNGSNSLETNKSIAGARQAGGFFHEKAALNRSTSLCCKCQLADSVSGVNSNDGNRSWIKDSIRKTGEILSTTGSTNVIGLDEFHHLKSDPLQNDKLGGAEATKHASQTNEMHPMEEEAWRFLRESVVYYCSSPVGTIAANDPSDTSVLNYDQVFIRDFIPSGIAFLLNGEYEIVRNFILHTLQLQSWEKTMDCHSPGQGLMPASFKVRTVPLDGDDSATEEVLDPDFGESAIGRVAPVDSGLWWIILLRAYGKCSGDLSVQERIDVQTGIKMILKLCLADGFDMFPTLLVTDGSCMIDRRLGIHGHPLEIQALFYSALLSAREMLALEDGSADLLTALNNRLIALSFHIREYYWVDMKKLNEVYRYKTEEYSYDAVNKFNIYPDQIPPWLVDWISDKGGYFIGNLQPAHMDFRFFSLGNLWSIVCSLATWRQSHAILDLIDAKWSDLVADMPLKICYPALEGQEWAIITGSDPKNTPWSYHNGGSWPTLLWQYITSYISSDAAEPSLLQLTVACIKMDRPEIAARAIQVAEKRISKDKWPEYYDTKKARFIGKQARFRQTWSIAGYLVAKQLLANPAAAKCLMNDEDADLVNALSSIGHSPRRKRGSKGSNGYII